MKNLQLQANSPEKSMRIRRGNQGLKQNKRVATKPLAVKRNNFVIDGLGIRKVKTVRDKERLVIALPI